MPPVKTFINNSAAILQMTLFVRQGTLPFNQDGTVSFTLNPQQTLDIEYGSDQDPFLNGLSLFTIFEGDLYSKIQFVTVAESLLDNLLNTNNVITITSVQTDYVITGSNNTGFSSKKSESNK